jgi:hypothetical protein
MTTGQTTIHKTSHRKQNIEQPGPRQNPEVIWSAPDGWAVPVQHVAPVVLQSGDKSWMRKWPDCDYDKRNIFVVIYDTYTP